MSCPDCKAPRLLRIPEAADALACSRRQVYNLIADGRLASVAVASVTRVRQDDVVRFIAANTTPARRPTKKGSS